MDTHTNAVSTAIAHIGLKPVADAAGLWPSAISKWKQQGRLPRSELAGLTNYALMIETLSGGAFKREDLLACTRAAWSYTKPGRRRNELRNSLHRYLGPTQ